MMTKFEARVLFINQKIPGSSIHNSKFKKMKKKICMLLNLALLAIIGEKAGQQVAEAAIEVADGPLRILLMVPVYEFNRSHVNFAISIYRALRHAGHYVHFRVPCLWDKDKKYLEEMMEKDKDLRITFYSIKNPQRQAEAEEEINYRHGRKVAIWIDMLENRPVIDHLRGGADLGAPFDVGIAELSLPNEYAFAVFDALAIPHTVVTKAYSPNALQYHDLGLLQSVIDANIPPVDSTKLRDHIDEMREIRRAEIANSYWQKFRDACDAIRMSDKKFEHFGLPNFAPSEEEEKQIRGQHENNDKKAKASSTDHLTGLRRMFANARFFLLNSQPEIEFDGGKILKSSGEKVKMIGGLHLKPRAELRNLDENQDIVRKMESTRLGTKTKQLAGIVLVSFGTVVDTRMTDYMRNEQFEAILNAIRASPNYLFIWQLTEGDPRIEQLNNDGVEGNIYASSWIDQQSILADPRTAAFISHCGRNSQLEAAVHGVPLICVPHFQDQFYNAESSAAHRMATVLNYNCIVEGDGQHQKKSHLVLVKDSENRIVGVEKIEKKAANDCFTAGNIKRALDGAIGRRHRQNGAWTCGWGKKLRKFCSLAPSAAREIAVDLDKVASVKEEMQREERAAQKTLLEAMAEIGGRRRQKGAEIDEDGGGN